jgi:hypothetical protein
MAFTWTKIAVISLCFLPYVLLGLSLPNSILFYSGRSAVGTKQTPNKPLSLSLRPPEPMK